MEFKDGKVAFGENEALKALINGASWNGGTHRWSLPAQAPDGSWTPGEWTPRVPVSMTPTGHADGVPITGWYLTRDLVEWWCRMNQHATDAYLVEWRGAAVESYDKIGVEECRLLRPLTDEELVSCGVYRNGQHANISTGRAWVGGSAVVEHVSGNAFVGILCGSGRVERVSGGGGVGRVFGNGRVESVSSGGSVAGVCGNGRVGRVFGNGRVESVRESGCVEHVCGFGRVGSVFGDGRVGSVAESGRVEIVYGNGRVEHVSDNGRVEYVAESGRVERVSGNGSVGHDIRSKGGAR